VVNGRIWKVSVELEERWGTVKYYKKTRTYDICGQGSRIYCTQAKEIGEKLIIIPIGNTSVVPPEKNCS